MNLDFLKPTKFKIILTILGILLLPLPYFHWEMVQMMVGSTYQPKLIPFFQPLLILIVLGYPYATKDGNSFFLRYFETGIISWISLIGNLIFVYFLACIVEILYNKLKHTNSK
ncbi:MAG: hypothetical protein AABX51_01445 [Nanoarchaeota archaeon]